MEPEVLNLYIQRLLDEVGEGAKTRILLDAQLKYTQNMNQGLAEKIQHLETQIVELQEKLSKKINKTKEVNTSDTF